MFCEENIRPEMNIEKKEDLIKNSVMQYAYSKKNVPFSATGLAEALQKRLRVSLATVSQKIEEYVSIGIIIRDKDDKIKASNIDYEEFMNRMKEKMKVQKSFYRKK